MNPYPGYFFDLDGTLVDTAPDIGAALNHTLKRHGYAEVDEALTRHWIGHGARVLIEHALKAEALRKGASADRKIPSTDIEPLLAVFLDYYRAHLTERGAPFPGVVEALRAMQARGARMAVVTNKLAGLSVPLLTELRLDGFFQTIIGGDTAARPKPAADPALLACERLDLRPAEALFVGDSAADVSCARAAGCPVVVVRDGYSHGTPAAELGADAVIESFLDLV